MNPAVNSHEINQRGNPIQYPFMSRRTEFILVALILITATTNALLWSLVRPPGSGGPDEQVHISLILRAAEVGGIPLFRGLNPDQFAGLPSRMILAHEFVPNLSIAPVALVLGLIDSHDFDFNTHVARLFNVALLPVTLMFAYLTLRRLLGLEQIARIFALAVMAVVPMFTLVFSYVTNDSPTIAASTVAAYLALRAWQGGFRGRDVGMLGIALGIVALHKFNGFVVFPAVGVFAIAGLWRTPPRLLRVTATLVFLALAVSLWWYVRMWVLYGDAMGLDTTKLAVDAAGTAVKAPIDSGLSAFEYAGQSGWFAETFATFWAGYGRFTMKLPGPAYIALLVTIVISVAGLIFRVLRAARSGVLFTVRTTPFLVFGGMFISLWAMNFSSSYNLDGAAMHGRYAFPAFVPFVLLLTLGLGGIPSPGRPSRALAVAAIPLLMAANFTYFLYVLIPDVVAYTG